MTHQWRTSSFTAGNGNCVEVAWPGAAVAVRDTKNRTGGQLTMPTAAFDKLVTTVRETE
jgi:hypothetical protein